MQGEETTLFTKCLWLQLVMLRLGRQVYWAVSQETTSILITDPLLGGTFGSVLLLDEFSIKLQMWEMADDV